MSITINGNGTIDGISVGGIPDGVVDTDVLAANAVTFGKIGTTEQGQLCKAWVNFDGTGTVAIRAAYNVSSITDNGTGDYTVNLATALVDADYGVSGFTYNPTSASASNRSIGIRDGSTNTSNAFRVQILSGGGSASDQSVVSIIVFR